MLRWAARPLMQLLGGMPLPVVQFLGRGLGWVVYAVSRRDRCVAQTNLKICLPGLSSRERRSLAFKSAGAMGAALFEAPRLWRLGKAGLTDRVLNPELLEEIVAEYEEGNGLVIASPHLGSWEFAGLLFAAHTQLTSMYRPPKMAEIGSFVRAGRERAGSRLIPADMSGIKEMVKALTQGQCVGILPDQEPEAGSGVYASFFDYPAYTMYLLPRLIQKHHVPAVFVFAERRPAGKFFLHALWADEALYNKSPELACHAMNRIVEKLILRCPEQYNWIYKRFRAHPDGFELYHQHCLK